MLSCDKMYFNKMFFSGWLSKTADYDFFFEEAYTQKLAFERSDKDLPIDWFF